MREQTWKMVKKITEAINKKKVLELNVLDVNELTPLAEVFIIAIAGNIRQTKAIADEVENLLVEEQKLLVHKEGYDTANWILLDYGEIIVHILDEEDAQFYRLDRLWQDAPVVSI